MATLIPFNHRRDNWANTGLSNIHNMLDDFFSTSYPTMRSLSKDTFKMDIQERDKDYVIEAELPGVGKENIKLSMNDDCLTIAVEVSEENKQEDEQKNYVHKERRYSSMSRSVYLGDANKNDISAKLNNGILSVVVPKQAKEESVKTINIE
ncbi:MAG: Hsp20/alpha crystallin family protein [Eubacteriales bacterium]|nr:Hsp20/alpha crystallin family protein [Eubacteriales bacterium]